MAYDIFVTIEGATQGQMATGCNTSDSMGSGFTAAHEDEIRVYKFLEGMQVGVDPQSGELEGSRLHKPASILKPLDKASPLLRQALATKEACTIELTMTWDNADGGKNTFTIKWSEARFCDFELVAPGYDFPDIQPNRVVEEWKFTARKIEWSHDSASTSASDDWSDR